MLPVADWLHSAEALPVGGKARVNHSCGSGRKMLVEHKQTGYAAWCYRCGLSGWKPKGKPSLAERIASLRGRDTADTLAAKDIRPPMPAVFEAHTWPTHAKLWLYKAGLNNDWIDELGFYYHVGTDRVVMPVLSTEGELLFWQARGFSPDLAKYISQPLGSSQHKPTYRAVPTSTAPIEIRHDTLCLTEDILSAVRVGQTCHAWSILGTSLSASTEAEIAAFGASRVLVWLDPDDAGVKGRRKIVPKLRAMGINARAVRADLDPKNYPFEEIRKRVHG